MAEEPPRDSARGLFGITTAAELVGMGVQNLRLYERKGLVTPNRTEGGTRRYSEDDLVVLRRIAELLEQGLNLAGISAVLGLEADVTDLTADNADLRAQLHDRDTANTESEPPR